MRTHNGQLQENIAANEHRFGGAESHGKQIHENHTAKIEKIEFKGADGGSHGASQPVEEIEELVNILSNADNEKDVTDSLHSGGLKSILAYYGITKKSMESNKEYFVRTFQLS